MFKKPFKIKSNTQLKGSDRKTLRDLISKTFSVLSEENVEAILPKKEVAFRCKIITASNKPVIVYLVQKRAILFSIDDIFYPSVYLLWEYPQIGINFTTNDFVLSKINQGADLMVPGLIRNPAKYETFLCKQIGVINTCDNQAAAAVGCIALSSREMLSTTKGKCVLVYHTVGDKLCQMDDMPSLKIPQMGKPSWISLTYSPDNPDEFPPLSGLTLNEQRETQTITKEDCKQQDDKQSGKTAVETPMPIASETSQKTEAEFMDDLLETCFLTAIKYSKTLQIPILTSAFYRNEMISNCPEGHTLDISKSSFKKVGQFLKHMETMDLIQIKEMKKGVETIEQINKEHEVFLNFYLPPDKRRQTSPQKDCETSQSRNVVESYQITKLVSPIFKECGYNQGDTATGAEVRKVVTGYVKKHNLQDAGNKGFVRIEGAALKNLYTTEVAVTWEDLFNKVIETMSVCFQFMNGNEGVCQKGKLPLIMMSTQTRSGNKKVTIVENLDVYNIRLAEFAKECQHGVAASTSISKPPGKKREQILIQGNQILFVHKLLTEKYQIPKKFIRGLENAPKKK